MKYAIWSVAIILSFLFGRVMYTPLGPALVKEATPKDEAEEMVVTFGTGANQIRVSIELDDIAAAEEPRSVVLEGNDLILANDEGGKKTLSKGDRIEVVKREGSTLFVATEGFEGDISMSSTDYLKQIIKSRAPLVMNLDTLVAGGPGEPENPPTPPTPTPEVTPPPSNPGGTPVVNVDPPNNNEEEDPGPGTEAEMENEDPEPAGGNLDAEAIVALMKTNLEGGSVQEFSAKEVEKWEAGEEEEVDGELYQTGLVTYRADTIFGPKPVQAKALIQGGKLIKWIYAKTGMQIH